MKQETLTYACSLIALMKVEEKAIESYQSSVSVIVIVETGRLYLRKIVCSTCQHEYVSKTSYYMLFTSCCR